MKPDKSDAENVSREEALRAPVTRDEVMEHFRRMIIASADHLALLGPGHACIDAFLGFSTGDWELGKIAELDPSRIDLSRYRLTDLINRAYDFAWQVGPRSNRWEMDEVNYFSMMTFLQGSHPTFLSNSGDVKGLGHDTPLGQTLRAASARQNLTWGSALDVRELALLARMTESATRASLSKEGIRTTSEKSKVAGLSMVSNEEALRWLNGRRGYIPTERPRPTDPTYLTSSLRALLNEQGWASVVSENDIFFDFGSLAEMAEVDATWLIDLIMGGDASPDIAALERVAGRLSADVPRFVGFAIERLLRAKAERQHTGRYAPASADQPHKGR